MNERFHAIIFSKTAHNSNFEKVWERRPFITALAEKVHECTRMELDEPDRLILKDYTKPTAEQKKEKQAQKKMELEVLAFV